MGSDFVDQNKFQPKKILRRTQAGQAKEGFVKVSFSGPPEKVELHFDREKFYFINDPQEVQFYLRGYGSTRLLPRKSATQALPSTIPSREVKNLFNPFEPLFDVEPWLLDKKNQRFDSVALAYKDILRLESKSVFKRGRKQVIMIDPQDAPVSLDELSDGYQSVLALATDIIAGIPEEYSDFRNAYGIVLIDEIGANLHPRWRMEFVARIRRTFPRIQFIVSTHEPLCLRGLKEKEISVFQRTESVREVHKKTGGIEKVEKHVEKNIVVLDEGLPDPAKMRSDQLLTSHFFGLNSTIDPVIDEKFQAYYTLLNLQNNEKGDGLDPELVTLRKNLEIELKQYNIILGFTRRDQMAYDLIDDYLRAKSANIVKKKWEKLRKETKRKIFEIWNSVPFRSED